ncbi:putative Delta-sarcoglycan-like 2, partial [Homarus americanus]
IITNTLLVNTCSTIYNHFYIYHKLHLHYYCVHQIKFDTPNIFVRGLRTSTIQTNDPMHARPDVYQNPLIHHYVHESIRHTKTCCEIIPPNPSALFSSVCYQGHESSITHADYTSLNNPQPPISRWQVQCYGYKEQDLEQDMIWRNPRACGWDVTFMLVKKLDITAALVYEPSDLRRPALWPLNDREGWLCDPLTTGKVDH